jgi:beta-phosphoglucomutase
MKRQNQFNAVLFDLDGVIVFTDKYHYLAWRRLSDEQGWLFDETLNHRLRGVSRMASLQIILDHNRLDLCEKEKEALSEQKNRYYLELVQDVNEADLFPGAVAFVEQLKSRGLMLGLCSSSRNALMVLNRLGLTRLFDTVVTGTDITRTKPDPEIFLIAAQRLKVLPKQCVVFEDALAGIQAALSCGMRAIFVKPSEVVPHGVCEINKYTQIDINALIETGIPYQLETRV